jgi:outer membrane lipoprotein carrier protein
MKKLSVLNTNSLRAGVIAWMAALAVIAISFSVMAQDSSGSGTESKTTVLDKIQDHYEHTESFTAKFTEELTALGGTTRTRSGQVWYKRPGMMRWEFESPHKETVVSDGHKLYDYQPDLNQVLEMPLNRAFKSSAPLTFLLGMGNLRRDFKATLAPAETPGHPLTVVLTPKSGGDRITMEVNPSDYDLKGAKVTDALENTTAVSFSSVQRNVTIADSKFHFEVPPGADVVQAPGAPAQRQL